MSILNQKTIKNNISIKGIGLHTGKKASVIIKPSNPNTGIIFKRVDIKNKLNFITPRFENVVDTTLCTTIGNHENIKVSTIEHLMGAFYGLGIDNATVEIDTQEIPILDGSAKDWVKLILNAGIKYSDTPIKIIKIEKDIEIVKNDKFIKIFRTNVSLDIEFEIKYPNCLIGIQKNSINVFNDDLNDVFNSRTFCKYEDIDKLRTIGLARGGSLENAIVVDKYKILNKQGLRNDKEFVNHKILDCMGDLYLSGYKIIGSVKSSQGGHTLTRELLAKIFSDINNYSLIELKGKSLPHTFIDKSYLKSIA